MTRAEAACADAVETRLRPELEAAVSAVLGASPDTWFEFVVDETTHSPVLLFRYPTTQPPGFAYLRRMVKLEFGSLTDQRPTERHPVRPWIADVLEEPFADWRCDVVALDVHRTFWEKATILHSEHHRPLDRPTPDRFSRHYADTVALARPGTFRLAPATEREAALRRDYDAMRDMYLGTPELFEDILRVLTDLERRINESP